MAQMLWYDTSNWNFDNELGFKFQLGLNYEFNEKLGMLAILLLGSYNKEEDGEHRLSFRFCFLNPNACLRRFIAGWVEYPFQGTYN